MLDLLLFSTALVAALIATPWTIRLARRLGWVDHPGHRKLHAESMPVLGGLAIVFGCVPALALLIADRWHEPEALTKIAFVVGAGLFGVVLGLVDDRRGLRWRHKLSVQGSVALVFSLAGFRFGVLDLPALDPVVLGWWAVPITVVWMVAVCNAVNLIDGVDGLALTVAITILAGAAFCAHRLQDSTSTALLLVVVGASLGVLLFNWAPARIYLGDGGSLGLGLFLGAALLAIGQDGSWVGSPTPIRGKHFFTYRIPLTTLLVLYPLLEICLSAARRSLKGKSIARADNDHIHHCLLRRSWSAPAIALAAAMISALAAGGVYARLCGFDAIASILFISDALVIGVLLHHCGYVDQFLRGHVRSVRPAFRMAEHFASMQRLKLGATRQVSEVLTLVRQACTELGVEQCHLVVARDDGPAIRLDWGTDEAPPETLPDRVSLRDADARAYWKLAGTRPRDLEMEHRLLLDELLREALVRLRTVPRSLRDLAAGDDAVACCALADRDAGQTPERVPTGRHERPSAVGLSSRKTAGHPS